MQRNKKVWPISQKKLKSIEIIPEEAQIVLPDKHLKSAIKTAFQEKYENSVSSNREYQ